MNADVESPLVNRARWRPAPAPRVIEPAQQPGDRLGAASDAATCQAGGSTTWVMPGDGERAALPGQAGPGGGR